MGAEEREGFKAGRRPEVGAVFGDGEVFEGEGEEREIVSPRWMLLKNPLVSGERGIYDEAAGSWLSPPYKSRNKRDATELIPYTDLLIGSAAILANALLLCADRHFDSMAEGTELKVRSLVPLT